MIVEPSIGAQALRSDHQAAAPAQPLPAVGSTLQLSVLSREQLGVRVVTEQGLTLLLPGLVAAELQPGAQLLMRVVATQPRLQLLLLPLYTPAHAAEVAPRQLPAAAEQARLQGWQLQKPAADTLAAGWRGLLLAAVAKPLPDGGATLPAMLLAGVRAEHDPQAQARRLAEQGWCLAHCWSGQTLRLALAEEEPAAGGDSGDELLLQLQLPYWGAVLLRLRSSSAGPLLQLHSESATVLAQWQACLPRWRQAMLAAGYPLLLQLQLGRLEVAVARAGPGRRTSVPALAQFRLAAHMILLLQAAAEEALAAGAPPAQAESTTT
ncbi:hypothetical protein ACFPAG_15765 [Vogesella sp. GCM10023246]|uniref:Flagellar hook-length control protein FliK n=1 Tax=Vogesella oryzagri TaxID=3160864 RepID=A0ABV1M7A6_9NEIS